MLNLNTQFGARVARHLREARIIWLTTVRADGMPQPNPVWFIWDGETILIYAKPTARRLRHLAQNPKVALNFDTDEWGEDIVILTGEARVDADAPSAASVAAYVEKYRAGISRIEMTPESFAQAYSVAIRVTPLNLRGD